MLKELLVLARLKTGGIVIGQLEEHIIKDAYLLLIVAPKTGDVKPTKTIRSMFWPFTDDKATVSREDVLCLSEVKDEELSSKYQEISSGIVAVPNSEVGNVLNEMKEGEKHLQK